MLAVSMQGTSISLSAGNSVAVDTGTTLIGGPSATVASIFAAIPGSRQMSGSYRNYYEYPCTTKIDFQLAFGGFTIKVTDRDFNLGRYGTDQNYCTGAVFIQNLPAGSPVQWIVGDSALKNVYSVYRFNPPAVGFAQLAGASGATPSATAAVIPSGGSLDDGNPGMAETASVASALPSPSSRSNSGVSTFATAPPPSASGSAASKSSGSASKSGSAGGVVVATVTAVVTAGDANAIAGAAAAASSAAQAGGAKSAAGRSVLGMGMGAMMGLAGFVGVLAL